MFHIQIQASCYLNQLLNQYKFFQPYDKKLIFLIIQSRM
jgi:hypothetical protein